MPRSRAPRRPRPHTTESDLIIRAAREDDVEKILDLLEPQEFVRPLTRDELRRLLDYRWTSVKPDFGFVLASGKAIGGFAGTIYSPTRVVEGNECVTVNSGTLFVRIAYRARRTPQGVVRYSEELARVIMNLGHPVYVFSAKGPNDVVPGILTSLGFEEICSADIFYPLWNATATLVRPAGTVFAASGVVRRHLSEQQLMILRDHEPYGCSSFVVREGDDTCFVVTKRRRYRGEWLWPSVSTRRIRRRYFPVSDVLHVSNPAIAVRSWGRLAGHICRKERTFGVTCARSFLGSLAPPGTPIPQKILTYGRTASVGAVDKLYSELVLLP